MRKLRLSVLLLAIGAMISWGIYSRTPARVDGSSVEALEKSMDSIQDSLPEEERAEFRKDVQDALAGVGFDHPKLLTKVMLASLKPEAAVKAKALLMEKLANRVDGMTLKEFRAFAAEGRKRKREVFDRAHGSSLATRQPEPDPPPLIKFMWDSEEDLLGSVPKPKVETHEIKYGNNVFLVDLPVGTTIKDGYMPRIILPTGELAELTAGPFNTDQLKIFNGRRAKSDPQDTIVFSNSTIHIEQRNPEKEKASERPFSAKMNVVLGPYRCFGVEFESGGYPKGMTLEPLVQLVAGLKTARLKSPDPEDPIALLDALDIEHEPAGATKPSEVRRLKFPPNSTFAILQIAEKFKDIETLIVDSDRMSYMGMDEARPLRSCQRLKRLRYSPGATGYSVDSILQHPELVELELSMASNDISDEGFRQLGELKYLEHLTLEVDGTKTQLLDTLANCTKLRHLSLETSFCDTPVRSVDFLSDLKELTELKLHGEFDATVLGSVAGLSHIESFEVSVGKLTGQSVQPLTNNTALKKLTLEAQTIKFVPGDLLALSAIPLEELVISQPGVRDRPSIEIPIQDLAKVKTLKSIGLYRDNLTIRSGDLGALCGLALEEIAIRAGGLSDKEVQELNDCKSIKRVSLSNDSLTIDAFKSLLRLPNLEHLQIDSDAVEYEEMHDLRKANPEVKIESWYPSRF